MVQAAVSQLSAENLDGLPALPKGSSPEMAA